MHMKQVQDWCGWNRKDNEEEMFLFFEGKWMISMFHLVE